MRENWNVNLVLLVVIARMVAKLQEAFLRELKKAERSKH